MMSEYLRGDSILVVRPLFQEEEGGSIPTSPLQFFIGPINMPLARGLVARWHSVLPETDGVEGWSNNTVCYGAEFDGRYYAVMIWTDPIAGNRLTDGASIIELRRFAIASEAPKNTASRMLAVTRRFLKQRFPHLKKAISYQAKEHHDGTIYKAAGWTRESEATTQQWHVGESRGPQQIKGVTVRWSVQF